MGFFEWMQLTPLGMGPKQEVPHTNNKPVSGFLIHEQHMKNMAATLATKNKPTKMNIANLRRSKRRENQIYQSIGQNFPSTFKRKHAGTSQHKMCFTKRDKYIRRLELEEMMQKQKGQTLAETTYILKMTSKRKVSVKLRFLNTLKLYHDYDDVNKNHVYYTNPKCYKIYK